MTIDTPTDTSPLPEEGITSPVPVSTRVGRVAIYLRHSWRGLLLPVGTVVMTALLVALVPVEAVEQLGSYGYLGVFVLTLLSSASIVLPSPALATAIVAGATLNFWLVGLIAGVAAGLGETTGYVAGYSGSRLAMDSRWYPRVESWVRRWGALTVLVLAAVPSPLIDLAGIAAGTLRMPYRVYLVACITGKVVRFIPLAWLGGFLM
jgi:membrane protein YqaA with SNARE-associated domain